MALKLKTPAWLMRALSSRRMPRSTRKEDGASPAVIARSRKPDLDKLKNHLKSHLKNPLKNRQGGSGNFRPAKGAHFVILVGDEGAILVHMKDRAVLSRQFAPDASTDNLKEFAATMAKDEKAPVLLVIDSMDQSYVQQTLPPVSAMSVGKLIKRRLDRDFGADDIKGALLLGREKTGRKDWNFLMVSLEKSPQLKVWLDFIGDLPNRFAGIHLVSVEVENLGRQLDRAAGNDNGSAEWKFFVSHNKVGGYRQVILRNGRILFTRLAQPLGDSTPEMVAGNIEQEILSTIEYMKRLSYDGQSGLDIYIIAANAIKPLIDRSRLNATSLQLLSPFEVARIIGIEGATQPTDQFGDVILAASIGASRKHILTLSTPQAKKIDGLYQLLYYQRLGAVLAVLGIISYGGYELMGLYQDYAQAVDLNEQKAMQQKKLAIVRLDVNHSAVDINKMNDVIELYRQLLAERITPLPFFARLSPLLEPGVRLSALEWSSGDEKDKPASPAGNAVKILAKLTIEFSAPEPTPDILKILSQKTLDDIKTAFPGTTVAYSRPLASIVENEKIELNFNDKMPAQPFPNEGKTNDAELTISGNFPGIVPSASPSP